MFQSPGYLGLKLEPSTPTRVECELDLNFLERDVAVQLRIAGDEDLT